eukprot:810926-Rhodomonas_salina.1
MRESECRAGRADGAGGVSGGAEARHTLLQWKVKVVALAGQDLAPADMNGLADPYVAFLCNALQQWAFTT